MTFEEWRQQMPVTQLWAYFDHAAVAPLPAPAARVIQFYAESYQANGIAVIQDWVDRIREVRRLAGKLVNADPHDLAFVPSTTMGISIVAEGYPFQPGENIVSVADEYPSNQYPWMNLRDRGVEFRAVPTVQGRVDLDALFGAVNDKTRLLTISSVEYATGFRNDLAKIGEFCQLRNIFFFVDTIQSLGVSPLDVQQLPLDAFAADGHKWLLGPEGAGLLYLKRKWIENFRPIGVGWNSVVDNLNFGKIDFRLKPHVGRWEGGTTNMVGLTALGESIRLLLDVGIVKIEQKLESLTDRLCEALTGIGWSIYSSRQPGEKSAIVSISKDGVDPLELQKRCRDAGVIVNVRGGRLRISAHGYNTWSEMEVLLEILRKY
ncbi:aminotransferase class V-fold PLP-dependent enzyme [Telmatocola sphagniphila]|uniref:Aminotransferase class V-fold PLP-dependent enzyme n=1 Tax=Telmatocola sphagniphila TaxID=1123043 RepID=A0A8E6ET71_9BACT|nr:aminotransferase class V-fold PLP-dependent enzyme [Telmatocola sphagniphila]QVL32059.1 aminotransferase class V-fold PLP-dependent enzyme [Telmatocola sphagniphila]